MDRIATHDAASQRVRAKRPPTRIALRSAPAAKIPQFTNHAASEEAREEFE
jgi:hypothetical protein